MSDYMGLSFESFNTLQHKVERLKKALQEEDQERQRNKKNILKSIFKIKKIQKTDFDKAEKLYEMLDKYVEDNNYSKIAEITNGRIN
jgi:ATP/maltotriose-dependent transcriptional regulator MalT